MKKFRCLLLISLFMTSDLCASTIIFLQGTGCAGKSSICRELQKLDPSWKIVDEDAVFFEQLPLRCAYLFPEEFIALSKAIATESLFHAIVRNQVQFKEGTTDLEKNAALRAAQKIRDTLDSKNKLAFETKKLWIDYLTSHIIIKIQDYAAHGHNVIVDTWFLKIEHFERFKTHFNVVLALAYCPINDLVDRTIERNSNAAIGNFSSNRFFHQALMSFAQHYELLPKPNQESTNSGIDTLNLEILNKALNKVENTMTVSSHAAGADNMFTRGEFSHQQFELFKENLIYKFQDTLVCSVLPKLTYDILIRTNELTPFQSAQHLLAIEGANH